MAALGSQSIASSYEQLLHVDADGGGNSTTHVSVKDGDNGTTFGFTIASDALMMSSTNRLEFGDTGTYIHQSADGVLDLVSDTEIELTATTIDINGAADLSGNLTVGGDVTVSGGDVTISNSGGHANLNIDSHSNEGSDSAIAFRSGTTERGYIYYDHNTTAASQAMVFNTGDNAVSAMKIDGAGNLIIGSPVTTARLCVEETVNDLIVFIDNGATSGNLYIEKWKMTGSSPDDNTSYFLALEDSTADRLKIWSDGDIQNHDNSYGSLSDERIKQDIRDANSQWDDIKALKVRNFKRKDDMAQYGDDAWEQIGVVAQEVEEAGMDKLVEHSPPSDFELEHCGFGTKTADAIPATYYEESDDIPEGKSVGDVKTEEVKEVWSVNQDDDGNDMQVKSMKYSILYMKAVKALQEAMGRIESLESKVEALEG